MPRPKNTEQRRAEIADALLEVMTAQGYERATIADIARAAGLTKGLLHYHFANKDEILMEAIGRLVAGLESRYVRFAESAGDDPRRQLDALIDAHLALGPDADPRAVSAWVVISAEAVRSEEVRRVYARTVKESFQRLEAHVRRVLGKRKGAAQKARTLATLAMVAIQGCYHLASAAPGLLPRGFAAPAVKRSVALLLEKAK